MKKTLVIVESPAKIKTLKKFFGSNFSFESSVGHIRDLPEKEFGIDIEGDFDPTYQVLSDKKDVVKKLINAAKKADEVYRSPDPDREGEAIAWHIAAILPSKTPIKRIAFYSLTKQAVLEALKNPRKINQSLVNAQQARRLLDRIVGYKISPILTRRVKRGRSGISAGRVQSVALKLIVDREKEIDAFIPVEYWNVKTQLTPENSEKSFEAFVFSIDKKKIVKEPSSNKNEVHLSSKKQAHEIADILKKEALIVSKVEKKEKKRHPVPPFITSTLQQEAARHFNFPVSKTMGTAQSLYEGIDMGNEGTEGLITYMRTDSVQVASEAIEAARSFVKKTYGNDYLPDKPNLYTSKKSAQEAHEAIRPTNLDHPPESIKSYLNPDQYKIYVLIWKRFIASQMKPAIYDTVSAQIQCDHLLLRANGSIVKFQGFLAVYQEKTDTEIEEDSKYLPDLKENQKLDLKKVDCIQSFTKPPPRFTEASLVKELEKSGIGRPSTYAAIMNKIHSRDYTTKEKNTLKPTDLGKIIAQMLEENFKLIMDVGFTASMEDQLELIAESKKEWKKLIGDFWKEFSPLVEKAEKEATVPKILTDIDCPKCGKKLQKIWSRNKYFYGCSNYPDCDFTTPIEALEFNKEDYAEEFNWDQACPNCGAEMTVRHGRFGPFLGCSKYPECNGIVNVPKQGETIYDANQMPDCPAIGCDGSIVTRKSRYGKRFFACSNYPDCDVIGNVLAELPQKYADHPKTPAPKKTTKKRGKKGAKTKEGKRLLTVSKELQAIVKKEELTRAEILKEVWVYIKANDLQDPKNKRRIVPDENLAKVFGSKEPIDMMKLSTVLKPHMK